MWRRCEHGASRARERARSAMPSAGAPFPGALTIEPRLEAPVEGGALRLAHTCVRRGQRPRQRVRTEGHWLVTAAGDALGEADGDATAGAGAAPTVPAAPAPAVASAVAASAAVTASAARRVRPLAVPLALARQWREETRLA